MRLMGRIGDDKMLHVPDYESYELLCAHVSKFLLKLMNRATPEDHFPPSLTMEQGMREWNSLIKLLEAKDVYIPEMPMEYMLFRVIAEALEEGIEPPPIPTEAKGDLDPDEIEAFENLEAWLEILFWDWDFMFLNDMSEQELVNSTMAEELGIGSPNETRFDIDGTEIRFRNRPWEME